MATADINFYFDPVCPFAWMTSKWVRMVQRERDYTVEWRLISLRMLNSHIDYDAHFPPEYDAMHTAGLRLLRVAASVREQYGREGITAFYATVGDHTFDSEPIPDETGGYRGTPEFVAPILDELGMASDHVAALDDDRWDSVIQAETDEALALTGKDVGTPIIQFRPPEGVAFFGPVISRLPEPEQAVELWDHVIGLAGFPGFAELKRSLRELPQLRGLGVGDDDTGATEDWHGGSRRQKK